MVPEFLPVCSELADRTFAKAIDARNLITTDVPVYNTTIFLRRSTLPRNLLDTLPENLTSQRRLLFIHIQRRNETNHVKHRRRQDQHALLNTLLGDTAADVLDTLGVLRCR